jgi:hypothetical protein
MVRATGQSSRGLERLGDRIFARELCISGFEEKVDFLVKK